MSTSAGVIPASANAFGPLTAAAVVVMSVIDAIEWCVVPPGGTPYVHRSVRQRAGAVFGREDDRSNRRRR